MKRYRLLARAEIDGAVREPGYIFTLPKGPDGKEILGPHRTVEHSVDRLDFRDGSAVNNRVQGKMRDVPLYEEVPDDAEIAPNVERSGAVIAAEAVAGGTNATSDERHKAEERAHELEGKRDLSDDERKELEGLHEYLRREPPPPDEDEDEFVDPPSDHEVSMDHGPSSLEHDPDKNIGPESD